jgi:hypothetical protein
MKTIIRVTLSRIVWILILTFILMDKLIIMHLMKRFLSMNNKTNIL